LLRIDDRKDKIVADYDADLVMLDYGYDGRETFVRGKAQNRSR
jgi:N-acetylglucosamine-6-phosphate deacetylase